MHVSEVIWKDFKNFFIGNPNAYAIQWSNGKGYKAINGRITKEILLKHLSYAITMGSYNDYKRRGIWYCKWVCLDFDNHDGNIPIEVLEKQMKEIYNFLVKFYSINPNNICCEFSGNGYHIWIKLANLTTLKRAYSFKLDIAKKIKKTFNLVLEIFPKQREVLDLFQCTNLECIYLNGKKKGERKTFGLAKYEEIIECPHCKTKMNALDNRVKIGLGNLVKLPLSINHRGNKK